MTDTRSKLLSAAPWLALLAAVAVGVIAVGRLLR